VSEGAEGADSPLAWYRGPSAVARLPRGSQGLLKGPCEEVGEKEALRLIKGRVGSLVLLDGELYRLYLLEAGEASGEASK
jgi:hypothetical protein